MSYILYINQKEKVTEIPLPAANNKKIWLDVCGCGLDMEIYDGVWKMLSSDEIILKIDGKTVLSAEVKDGAVINVCPKSGEVFAVMAKEINAEKNIFVKYSIAEKSSVTIGRAKDNDIIIDDDYVSSHHCTISCGDGFTLTDSSQNDTFINGVIAGGNTVLNIFDTIYITGHKIIFFGNIIAFCENDVIKTSLPTADLKPLVNCQVYEDTSFFSRAPRRIEPLDTEVVEIDDPPAKNKSRQQPLIFIIGPSVTMPIPILVSVLVNIASNSGAGRSGIMYLGTALSVVLSALIGTGWALAHQMYNKNQLAADEKERTEAYTAYIENNKNLLEEKHNKNRNILEKSYLSTEKIFKMSESNPEILWNRNIYQNDFLTIRLGRGKVKFPAEINVSKQRFSLNNDELCKYPHELYDKYEMIENCASLAGILQHKIIGMAGNTDRLPLIVNNMICQLAALHCCTDVKIGFIAEESDREKYLWAKWLPHSFIRGTEARIIGFDANSRENVTYELASVLRRRAEMSEENGNNKNMLLPHIVLFCTSAELLRNSVLGRYMSSPVYLGVTFVLVYGGINMLPNECKAIIECSEDFSGFYLLDGEITEENKIDFELIPSEKAEKFARNISGYYVDEISTGSIPQQVNYFEMLGIGKIENWELIKNYKMNHAFEGLKSFIGLGQGGNPVYLDIHERNDGPHGLVAGTTGSGKSETLQTFVLSLAMNYSPADVAFVLIDYKGGGMANIFEGLPHVAGMITNLSDETSGELDKSLTRRACSSLKSEIKHRQSIFAEYKINSIDTYSKLYADGKAKEPMPHLVIISDEFAELKKEQPEFIKELVSVARVGRSLGIHLILATQKPSGVVDDEIWSNSRFRICLRVQDKQDSNGMLKRPDAAYITEAGRAFLQIGNDEIFEEFQSGYSGGEYEPKESVVSAADSEAVMIEIDGNPAVVHNKKKSDGNAETEIETAVKYISLQAEINKIDSARTLWLPPLAKNIFLDDISDFSANGQLDAVYGIVDNYEQQKQYPCSIDFYNCSNLKICGTAGCGKTTLLQTVFCSAVKKYSPELFNFYVMDFSSRTFKIFKHLPHCGGVVYEEETEAAERLIKLITDTIEERKKLFENEDIGSFKEYIKLHTIPLIVFAIDNFGAFLEIYGGYEETVLKLLHDSVRYGIQVVITINNTSELKYKMRSYVNNSIVLRMSEKSEYSEFVGRNPEFVPAPVSGQGLIFSGGSVLEYQTALPVKGENEAERSENMKKLFNELAEKYKDRTHAKNIPIISSDTKYADLLSDGDYYDSLLIGYNFETIMPYSIPLSSFYCFCVSCGSSDGIGLFMDNICEYTVHNNVTVKAVKLNNEVKFNLPQNSDIYTNITEIGELMAYMHKEFTERNKSAAEWNADSRGITRDKFMAEKFGRVFILIDDMPKFCEFIYGGDGKNYAELADMFFKEGKNHSIHIFGGYGSRKTYLAASNTFKSENHGIHLGGRADNQNVLDIDIPLPLKMKQLNSNIGFCVENNQAAEVYLPERR
ncbi:MAG: type VII secretion protein EssC [Eubacterium sp.]|nr:type VII secretion protein EssC [Eubacterium sp.]